MVVTAGVPRKPGMSRSDVLDINVQVIDQIIGDIMKYAPDAIVIMVTNPVDVLTYRVWQRTGWERERVIGQAGVLMPRAWLPSLRWKPAFRPVISPRLFSVGMRDTMVPVPRFCTVNGIPVGHFIAPERLKRSCSVRAVAVPRYWPCAKLERLLTRRVLQSPAMIDAISHHRNRLMPCVAILQGEYGEDDIAMGVPCLLSNHGLSR